MQVLEKQVVIEMLRCEFSYKIIDENIDNCFKDEQKVVFRFRFRFEATLNEYKATCPRGNTLEKNVINKKS